MTFQKGDPQPWNHANMRTTVEMFWSRCTSNPTTGCKEWAGGRNQDGYGVFTFKGKWWRTHCLAWTLTFGPIPEGMHVCHSCDNPPCYNPNHLWLGSPQANIKDRDVKGRQKSAFKDPFVQHLSVLRRTSSPWYWVCDIGPSGKPRRWQLSI